MLWLAKNTIKKCIQQILVKLLFKVTQNNFVRKENCILVQYLAI